MKKISFLIFLFCLIFSSAQKKYVMVIHGGAGTITKENMTAEKEKAYREKLAEALKAGYAELSKGKNSIEAVQAAIVVMEDSPLFNAGRGAVFTHEGKNEMDASIMYGKDLSAGAVAGVHTIKNPIKAAIAVMQKSEHVMLSGAGAEEFAKEQGLEIVDPKYFRTEDRWNGLQKALEKELQKKQTSQNRKPDYLEIDQKFGTVGAVALDKSENISAGTSTGGMTNKRWNRIGDSPIIGAGTYANSQVGVSGTGWGEYFIRATAARTLAAKMEYQNKNVKTATQETIAEIGNLGGDGGLIALDKSGNIAMEMNTTGMYRGAITDKGEVEIYIYKDENSEPILLEMKQKNIPFSDLKNLKNIDYIISNNSNEILLFNSKYQLEYFNGKNWTKVPFVKNLVFPDIEYSVAPNSSAKYSLYLNSFEKPLNKGKYRMTKKLGNKDYTTEFEIN